MCLFTVDPGRPCQGSCISLGFVDCKISHYLVVPGSIIVDVWISAPDPLAVIRDLQRQANPVHNQGCERETNNVRNLVVYQIQYTTRLRTLLVSLILTRKCWWFHNLSTTIEQKVAAACQNDKNKKQKNK